MAAGAERERASARRQRRRPDTSEATKILSEVTGLSVEPPGDPELWDFSVEIAPSNRRSEAWQIEVRGWALGRRYRVEAVEFLVDDTSIWRVPVDRERADVRGRFPTVPGAESAGFYTALNTLRLPPSFEVFVRAVLSDGTRRGIGSFEGRRERLEPQADSKLDPVMVTSLGRSGSTLMMGLLAAHPEIVAHQPHDYEPRVASYWMKVLMSLSDPSSYLNQLDPAGNVETDDWWLRGQQGARELSERVGDEQMARWIGGDGVRTLAAACRQRIDELYLRIAEQERGGGARRFAEKFLPDAAAALTCEMYPRAKEILLVRDFRDMVCSALAYGRKRAFLGLGRDLAIDEAEYVREPVRNSVLRLVRTWERRRDTAYLVRYEDLVQAPEETLAGLLEYLELDHGVDTIALMTSAVASRRKEAERHATTPSTEMSVGRWRQDLGPALARECEQWLGFGLEAFGYTL